MIQIGTAEFSPIKNNNGLMNNDNHLNALSERERKRQRKNGKINTINENH